MSLSFLEANPVSGLPDGTIEFTWQIGDDIGVGCTTDDELRLVTTSGVLVARSPLRSGTFEGLGAKEVYALAAEASCGVSCRSDQVPWHAGQSTTSTAGWSTTTTTPTNRQRFRFGKCKVVCPPFAGGFVACIVEGGTFKRIIARPFRVTGNPFEPKVSLQLKQRTVTQRGRVELIYFPSDTRPGDLFVVKDSRYGDNEGFNADMDEGVFGKAASVHQVPHHAGPAGTHGGKSKRNQHDDIPISPNSDESLSISVGRSAILRSGSASVRSPPGTGQPEQEELPRTLAIVAPQTEGTYQTRLVTTPLNGIPYTRCISPEFTVIRSSPAQIPLISDSEAEEPRPRKKAATALMFHTSELERETNAMIEQVRKDSIWGTIRAGKHSVFLGEPVQVSFCFTKECGEMLSELDTIVFYPYGRSEEVPHNDDLFHTVGESLFAGSITLPAPLTEGTYDLAYYSFSEQRPLLTELRPVRVVAAHATLSHYSEADELRNIQKKAGKATGGVTALNHIAVPCEGNVVLEYTIDTRIYSPHDRIVVHDELSNVVESAFVGKPRHRRTQREHEHSAADEDASAGASAEVEIFVGRATINLFLPGEHIVYYYSSVLMRKLCRLSGFISVNPPQSASLPTAQLTTLKVWPKDFPVHFHFVKQGNDTRSAMEQSQDCVAIYDAAHPDFVHTHTRDASAGMSTALHVHYLRDADEDEFIVPPLDKAIKLAVRYMVVVNGHFHRICTSDAAFEIAEPDDRRLAEFHFSGLQHASLHDVAEVHHRFQYKERAVDMFADQEEGTVASSAAQSPHPDSSSLAGRGSVTGHLLSTASVGSRFSSVGAKSLGISGRGHQFNTFLHFTDPFQCEIQGKIFPPRVASTTEQVVSTYTITDGLPRGDDYLVLLSDDLQKIYSEVKVCLGSGRNDYTMGTVILLPPPAAGRYLLGYFSDRYQSIIFKSEPFRVTSGADEVVSVKRAHRPSISSSTGVGGGAGGGTGSRRTSHQSTTCAGMLQSPLFGPPSPSLIESDTDRPPRTRCLFVCIGYLRKFYEFKGPLNDGSKFATTLSRAVGVNLDNPEEFRHYDELSLDPSRVPIAENIREGLEWLVYGAKPKDQLIFYFSGAGSRVPSGTGKNRTADNALLPSDFDWNDRMITYKELHDSLFGVVQSGVAATAVIDACFTSNPHDICGHWGIWREARVGKEEVHHGSVCAHRGVAAIWRRRECQGIGPRAPWRCVASPRGLFPSLSTAPDDFKSQAASGASRLLFQPYTAAHTATQQDGQHALFLLYEASRCTERRPQGAWDVFLSQEGCTMGLFTQALCHVLDEEMRKQQEALASANQRRKGTVELGETAMPPMMWWEFHEKVCHFLRRLPYGDAQLPRLLVGDVSALGTSIFANTVAEPMRDLTQLPSLEEEPGSPASKVFEGSMSGLIGPAAYQSPQRTEWESHRRKTGASPGRNSTSGLGASGGGGAMEQPRQGNSPAFGRAMRKPRTIQPAFDF